MNYNNPDHYSYNFHLDLNRLPTKQSDRIALHLLFPGLICSFFLMALGFYEYFLGLDASEQSEIVPFWFNLTLFDCVIIALGLGSAVRLILAYFTYKKVFFDGKKVTIIHRNAFAQKQVVKESIKKYAGVRFRVEFFQFGFIPKNKFIIELYHKDFNKVAPLYISTSGHGIRKIWAEYAQKLNLPQLLSTDDGLILRKTEDIGKNIITLHEEGTLKNTFNEKDPLPASILWSRKKDKSVIKCQRLNWDAYSLLLSAITLISCLLLVCSFKLLLSSWLSMAVGSVLFLLLLSIFLKLVTKDKLVIKAQKIIVIRKNFLFSHKKLQVMKNEIETIDVAYSPVSERYFIIIIGGDKTLTFGKRLPLEDLNWIREFLINDIVKK